MPHGKIRKWIRRCLLVVIAVCLLLIVRSIQLSSEQEKEQERLREMIGQEQGEEQTSKDGAVVSSGAVDPSGAAVSAAPQEPAVLGKYAY